MFNTDNSIMAENQKNLFKKSSDDQGVRREFVCLALIIIINDFIIHTINIFSVMTRTEYQFKSNPIKISFLETNNDSMLPLIR